MFECLFYGLIEISADNYATCVCLKWMEITMF